MAAHLGVTPDRLLSVWQVHSPDCLHVTGPWPGERPKADAMATSTPGVALGIATADCGPLLFADAKAGVIGAAHAGWKGAIGGVIESTLARMEELGARRANVTVAMGPMLSQANYEVGPEFVAQFMAEDAGHRRFFTPSPKAGHAMFDLPAYNRWRLERAGVGRGRGSGAVHLRRRAALLQLPPHDAPEGAGLRPADLSDRSVRLTPATCPAASGSAPPPRGPSARDIPRSAGPRGRGSLPVRAAALSPCHFRAPCRLRR